MRLSGPCLWWVMAQNFQQGSKMRNVSGVALLVVAASLESPVAASSGAPSGQCCKWAIEVNTGNSVISGCDCIRHETGPSKGACISTVGIRGCREAGVKGCSGQTGTTTWNPGGSCSPASAGICNTVVTDRESHKWNSSCEIRYDNGIDPYTYSLGYGTAYFCECKPIRESAVFTIQHIPDCITGSTTCH